MSKDMYDMLFDRIPHENKYILEPKEIADYILYLEDKINQLTNNWNELEEWLKSVIEYETLHKGNYMTVRGEWGQEVLDKMKEIKDGNNVSDRD